MKKLEITDEFEKERVEYIYRQFKNAFPNTRFSDRSVILGVGEPGRYLACYFIRSEDGSLEIKFKNNQTRFSIQTDLAEIDSRIQETVKLFQENEFIKKKQEPRKKSRLKEEQPFEDTTNAYGMPKSLCRKARRATVVRAKKSVLAVKYLESVGYDETHFKKNSVGRVICLEKKLPEQTAVLFSESVDELVQTYLQKKDEFEPLLFATYEFLEKVFRQTHGRELGKETALLAFNVDGRHPNLQSVADVYQVTRESVSQRLQKELRRAKVSINAYSEDGIERWLARNEYLTLFSGYCVDSFMLYLKLNDKRMLLKGLVTAILFEQNCPEDWERRLLKAKQLLKEKEKQQKTEKRQRETKRKKEMLRVSEDGEVLTDLLLLEKLKEKRMQLANAYGVPLYIICKNDKLAEIEEKKPTCKEEYIACGFTEKSWEWFGSEMVKAVKEHLEKI